MEAAHTSETSIDICLTTRQYIPEGSELQVVMLVILKTDGNFFLTIVNRTAYVLIDQNPDTI
jgi:hypothetical protein